MYLYDYIMCINIADVKNTVDFHKTVPKIAVFGRKYRGAIL